VKEKVAKGKRGRPREPLARDPDRYLLALVQAHVDIAKLHGVSERHVVETYAGLLYGRLIHSRANVESLARGERFQVQFERDQFAPKGWAGTSEMPGPGWLNKNAFRPYADNLRRKLRKIRNMPPSASDRRWLAAMSVAWRICLQGNVRDCVAALAAWGICLQDNPRDCAKALTSCVGEETYFYSVMQPVLNDSFLRDLRPREDFVRQLSDFLHILIPTLPAK
jgi:hypothetical protein